MYIAVSIQVYHAVDYYDIVLEVLYITAELYVNTRDSCVHYMYYYL